MYALLLAALVVGVVGSLIIILLMFSGPHIEDSQFYGDVEITDK